MAQNWNDYEKAAEKGPMAIAIKALLAVFILSALVGTFGYVFGWFGEVAKVTQKEFGPESMIRKYEWFKDAAAQLEKKQADITVYESRTKSMNETYKNLSREKWPREDREQFNIWQSEIAGVKASYNQLASEYNSQMAKFNWRFANIGELPKGAEITLPREFKEYNNQ